MEEGKEPPSPPPAFTGSVYYYSTSFCSSPLTISTIIHGRILAPFWKSLCLSSLVCCEKEDWILPGFSSLSTFLALSVVDDASKFLRVPSTFFSFVFLWLVLREALVLIATDFTVRVDLIIPNR